VLQFAAPGFALFRQEAFHHVSEALHRYTQVMPGLWARLFHPQIVKIANARQLLENKLRQAALVYGNEFGPHRKAAQPSLPTLTRKRFQGVSRLSFGAALPLSEMLRQHIARRSRGQP
jgi:type II secretory pathway component PulL